MAGTWSTLELNPAPSGLAQGPDSIPGSVDVMLLLTDGSVMLHFSLNSLWGKLTPDLDPNIGYSRPSLSYLQSMLNDPGIPANQNGPSYQPLYFASAVLADGTVFVAGGEYNVIAPPPVDVLSAQSYNPVTDTWTILPTPAGWTNIGDSPICVLPDGRILMGQFNSNLTVLYNPATQTWATAGNSGAKAESCSEETFTLLPDGTVLTVQCTGVPPNLVTPPGSLSTTPLPNSFAEKYVIAQDLWTAAGTVNAGLPQPCPPFVAEIGPAILLPDGRVFVIGGSGQTALYTPVPANPSQPGTWAVGPTFLDANQNVMCVTDAPACLLPNGRVLCTASPGGPCGYPSPTLFFEFDPALNTLTSVAAPINSGGPSYKGCMLLLPTGQVLYTSQQNVVAIYTPDGPAPNPSWVPVILNTRTHIGPGLDFMMSGLRLNGLSQAVSYGDDESAATNYPIVTLTRLENGFVYYCRTHDHSSMGVATLTTTIFTRYAVPGDLPTGLYVLNVIANGIPSAPQFVSLGLSLRRYYAAPTTPPPSPGLRSLWPNGVSLRSILVD